jgi:hypothetical protein
MNNWERRQSQTKRTKEPARIPHLREKLEWLYRYHPVVKSHDELARRLGVSRAFISSWLNGTRCADDCVVTLVDPDRVPANYLERFLNIWAVPESVLELADLTQFKRALAAHEASQGSWERLVLAHTDDKGLEIILNPAGCSIDACDMADRGGSWFHIGDEIQFRAASPGYLHGVLMLQDRLGWSILRPSPRLPDTAIGEVVLFPRPHPDGRTRFSTLDTVGGIHRALMILTAERLPAAVLDILLARPTASGDLDRIVAVLQDRLANGPQHCRLLTRRFLVAASPRHVGPNKK